MLSDLDPRLEKKDPDPQHWLQGVSSRHTWALDTKNICFGVNISSPEHYLLIYTNIALSQIYCIHFFK